MFCTFINGDITGARWPMAKFDPAQIQNPSADGHKIWNIRESTPCAKLHANSSIGGFSANG